MKQYIFGERNGIYIIDLQKTHRLLQDALQFVQDLAAQGKNVLFIGTKRQAQEAIAEEAKRCGMPFVTERWLGGLLTNFVTVRRSLERLRELEMTLTGPQETRASGSRRRSWRTRQGARQAREEPHRIKTKSAPDAVFVIDTRREAIVVARRASSRSRDRDPGPNSDPDEVDVPIPGNDHALRAIWPSRARSPTPCSRAAGCAGRSWPRRWRVARAKHRAAGRQPAAPAPAATA
jgi:small subunit ribosomal protein S2